MTSIERLKNLREQTHELKEKELNRELVLALYEIAIQIAMVREEMENH